MIKNFVLQKFYVSADYFSKRNNNIIKLLRKNGSIKIQVLVVLSMLSLLYDYSLVTIPRISARGSTNADTRVAARVRARPRAKPRFTPRAEMRVFERTARGNARF